MQHNQLPKHLKHFAVDQETELGDGRHLLCVNRLGVNHRQLQGCICH